MENFLNNEAYENEPVTSPVNVANENNIVSMPKTKEMRPAFAVWEVGDKEIKLKLTTAQTLELEKKFRKNLISLLGDEDNIPPLTTMLQIIHAAAVPWQHGVKLKNIMDLYDQYQEQGGTQMNLYVDVYLKIYMVSGFFSSSMVEDMSDTMEAIQEKM